MVKRLVRIFVQPPGAVSGLAFLSSWNIMTYVEGAGVDRYMPWRWAQLEFLNLFLSESLMRNSLALVALAGLVACDATQQPLAPAANAGPALVEAVLATRYIVTVADGADASAVALQHGVTPRFVYGHAINGFAADLTDVVLASLRLDARVQSIEADQPVKAFGTQTAATWGIDRTDQRDLPLSTTYTYNHGGRGVKAYIIDTGIRFTHAEFRRDDGLTTRAQEGVDVIEEGAIMRGNDCNGHGTHVAGTVGGKTYGVAKEVTLIAVRVLDCTGAGWTSGVIYGVDWATAHHRANGGPSVANMSLGGGKSATLNAAVTNSIAAGIVYAIAAGNGDDLGVAQDACTVSPASVTEAGVPALTTAASNKTDGKASWSNQGACVDLYAPGVGITSSSFLTDTYTEVLSGTSMASPHVAGVAALYLEQAPTATPATVKSAIVQGATPGKITNNPAGTPNLLLYSLVQAPPPPLTCTLKNTKKC